MVSLRQWLGFLNLNIDKLKHIYLVELPFLLRSLRKITCAIKEPKPKQALVPGFVLTHLRYILDDRLILSWMY